MVTNFYEAYNKMFQVRCEIICFITYWVIKKHNEIYLYGYDKKKIKIPIYDYDYEIHNWNFYGLKVINGTLFVGVENGDKPSWFEVEDDSIVLTMQTLWNIVDVLYLFND